MTVEKRFKLVLLLNVLTGLCGFSIANNAAPLLGPVVVLAVAGWWVTEVRPGSRGRAGIPRWLATSILLIMLVVAVVRAWNSSDLVMAFAEFLASIIVLKLWEKREVRDYGQLLTLSLFMAVSATLSDTGFVIGVLWAVQLPLMVIGVMLYQIYSAKDRARLAASRALAEPPANTETTLRMRPLLATSSAMIASGLAFSIVVFIIIPRGMGGDGIGLLKSRGGPRVSGFSSEVEPGAGALISESQTSVIEMSLTRAGKPAGGPGESFYLRGAVLDSYDRSGGAGTWRERYIERNIRTEDRVRGGRWASFGGELPPDYLEQHITVLRPQLADNFVPVFALFQPAAIRFEGNTPMQTIAFDPRTARLQRSGIARDLSYVVQSAPNVRDPDRTERSADVSFDSERVHARAVAALRRSGVEEDPVKRPLAEDGRAARVMETYLRNNYVYDTKDLRPPVGEDSTEWFLDTNKRGHCEYFASAMASMCRSVGIDARIVAGYLANEYDASRDLYVVRESDAHAWVEVDTGVDGWQIFDATPVATTPRLISDTPFSRLGLLTDRIVDFWNANVVSFSQSQQERLIGTASHARMMDVGGDLYRWTRGMRRDVLTRLRSPVLVASIFGGVVLVVGGAVAGVVVYRMRRRRPGGPELGWAMNGQERKVYRRTLHLLAAKGYSKPSSLPPLVYLRTVALQDPTTAERAERIVSLLYESRFGSGGSDPLHEARRRVEEFARLS